MQRVLYAKSTWGTLVMVSIRLGRILRLLSSTWSMARCSISAYHNAVLLHVVLEPTNR